MGETAAASKPRSKAPSPAAAPTSSAAPSGTDFRDKYREAVQQIHRLESEVAKATRRSTLLEEERENLNGQLAKVVAVRDRLESLCRHLQERNKELMDKMKEDADKERASREQLVERFSSSVREIEEKIAAHSAERDDILAARERCVHARGRTEEWVRAGMVVRGKSGRQIVARAITFFLPFFPFLSVPLSFSTAFGASQDGGTVRAT